LDYKLCFGRFLTAGILLYWLAGARPEQVMVERVKPQEMTLARPGAFSIVEFFRERKTELLLFHTEAIRAGREKEGRKAMRVLVEQLREEPLADIVRVSREGKVLWGTNVADDRRGEGVSLADRDYFLWAKGQKEPGKVFVGKPVIPREGIKEGKWVVVMATPIFYQERLNGLVFISFPLGDLTPRFITPLVFSPAVQSLIIAQDGTIAASLVPGAIGQNALGHI